MLLSLLRSEIVGLIAHIRLRHIYSDSLFSNLSAHPMLVAYYSDFQVDGSHGYIKRTTSDFILRYLSNMFLFYSMVII